jgi:hypothetical protein
MYIVLSKFKVMANSFPIIGNERGGSKSRTPLISSRPALPPWTTSQQTWLQARTTLSTLFRKGFRKEEIGTGMRLSLHISPLSARLLPYSIHTYAAYLGVSLIIDQDIHTSI